MTCRQLLQTIQTKLRAAVWPGGSNKVFHLGSVWVTPGASPEDILAKHTACPMALIHAGSATVDPEAGENQDLLRQDISVTIVVNNENDPFGESSMLGAAKTGGATKSLGRGILEIETRLFAEMKILDADDGVNIVLEATGAAEFIEMDGAPRVVYRDYLFRADVTAVES